MWIADEFVLVLSPSGDHPELVVYPHMRTYSPVDSQKLVLLTSWEVKHCSGWNSVSLQLGLWNYDLVGWLSEAECRLRALVECLCHRRGSHAALLLHVCIQDVKVWVPGRGGGLSAEARTAWERLETDRHSARSIVISTSAGTALWNYEQNEGHNVTISLHVLYFQSINQSRPQLVWKIKLMSYRLVGHWWCSLCSHYCSYWSLMSCTYIYTLVPYTTQRPTLPSRPSIRSFTWCRWWRVETGDVALVVLVLAGQTNSATTLDLFLPTSGDETGHSMGPRWSDATARAGYA